MPDADHLPLLAELRTRFDAVLAEHLRGARRVAIVDFPDHDNIGDNAIWHGERQSLRRLGVQVVYSACVYRHRDERLAALPADVPVLIHGGGNFGDVWPVNHAFREGIIARFPGRRVVQLPQTVYFSDADSARASAERLQAHPDLTVLTRDEVGTAYTREVLGLDAHLIPDAALAIDPATLPARRPAEHPVVVQSRNDHERAAGPVRAPDGVPVFDWSTSPQRQVLSRLDQGVSLLPGRPARRVSTALHDRIAQAGVHRGLGMLQRGQVLVTDRLHGVVLATLSGVPSVWVDNSYGKLARLHDTWLAASPLSHRAESLEAAVDLAAGLAARRAG